MASNATLEAFILGDLLSLLLFLLFSGAGKKSVIKHFFGLGISETEYAPQDMILNY